MGADYNTLSTLKTPDLVFRDGRLMGKTRVMGMSQTAVTIHVVALVCTSGASLPINLVFCIWHGHRYSKVKKERKLIRQILGSRDVAYQGRGRWVGPGSNPQAAQHLHNPSQAQGQWVHNKTSAGHMVQGTPNAGPWVHGAPSGGHWVPEQPNPQAGQWVQGQPIPQAGQWVQGQPIPQAGQWVQGQPTPQAGQWVHGAAPPQANNDHHMQFTHGVADAAVSNYQQDFGNDPNSVGVATDDQGYFFN